GHDGPLVVSGSTVVNLYSGIGADAGPGDSQVVLTTPAGFVAGDAVMLLQVGGVSTPDAGDPLDIDLGPLGAGAWELHRVAAIDGGRLVLDGPLSGGFEGVASQVIRLPEYTSVDVMDGGRIAARPWDGATGGVLALLAAGTVTIDGRLDADGAGLRGGVTSQG